MESNEVEQNENNAVEDDNEIMMEQENFIGPATTFNMFTAREQAERERIMFQESMEENRRVFEKNMTTTRTKNEMITIATNILTENARSKPVSERAITAEQIVEFAQELINYVNQN